MPELPEVETIRRGLFAHVVGRTLTGITVRRTDLRWPVPENLLGKVLPGEKIMAVRRRGKYLLLDTQVGTVILHLGMSGVFRFVPGNHPAQRHDHVDFHLDDGHCLRLTDPRRFGAILWGGLNPCNHTLLDKLGPEPLDNTFDGPALYALTRGCRRPVKTWLMDSQRVAGIGNIYAVESLFMAGIHPTCPVETLTLEACQRLVDAIKDRLNEAIAQGGTTLRDFRHSDGRPGYFQQFLQVYGREGLPCRKCAAPIQSLRLGGRSSPCCPNCQSIGR
ncbi:MAG TPA: bifunctional DNA-formamidopyrimidine glycosylase/DNA-(apurinic or apyrimidinic site) lyase [Magnetococcales bacterium]|nr:bifunctional DNA-formamidopyrimidine glycosylase/DNA-(apurinic or apyrimidinic site) lyase [Magnetococcales bacterium]